jgi:squalene cyclase
MRALQGGLSFYEKWAAVVAWSRAFPCLSARARGNAFALRYMAAEDECTNYICIGPVNKAMNMLCVWAGANVGASAGASVGGAGGSASGPSRGVWTPAFKKHLLRCDDYLWLAEDGLKMQGYNGSQTWDTTFAVQAMVAALHGAQSRPGGLDAADAAPVVACIERARRFTLRSQIAGTTQWEHEPLRSQWFRCVSRGGWPFSTAAHGWPISDCTAEGVKALLASERVASVRQGEADDGASDSFGSSAERLNAAVSVLLALHNRGEGGWATYEKTRGWGWFEHFNPSEVFGDIMIDYCYVECTSASITALARVLAQRDPRTKRVEEMRAAIRCGKSFILSAQRADGSWYGSWGCCFAYAAWFAIEGLVCDGGGGGDADCAQSSAIAAATANGVRFLLSKQRDEDGGWGEGFGSCHSKEYDDAPSTSVATSWALLAILASKRAHGSARVREAVERGVAFLLARMERSGDFPQPRNISGVFNRSCGITYTAYRNVFPIWALAEYASECDAHAALRSSAEAASEREEERVFAAPDAAAGAGASGASGALDATASGAVRTLRAGIVAALAVLGAAVVVLVRAGVAAGTLEHPLGLLCGIGCVGAVQVGFTLPYYWWLMNLSSQPMIQREHAARGRKQGAMYAFYGLSRHLAQPEGFLLIGGYLSVTWLLRMLPASYYVVEAPTLVSCLLFTVTFHANPAHSLTRSP